MKTIAAFHKTKYYKNFYKQIFIIVPNIFTLSARSYALAYFASVPIFAMLFSIFSNHFYHSNISRELAVEQLRIHVANMIALDLPEAVENAEARIGTPKVGTTFLSYDKFDVKYLNVDERGDLSFLIRFFYIHLKEDGSTKFAEELEVRATANQNFISPNSRFGTTFRVYPEFKNIQHQWQINKNISRNSWSLYLRPDTVQGIWELREIARGRDPHVISNFFRMLYLSSVTITTLGYGDIVPVSFFARFLIAAETILGVTFAGLFFNAVSLKRKIRD